MNKPEKLCWIPDAVFDKAKIYEPTRSQPEVALSKYLANAWIPVEKARPVSNSIVCDEFGQIAIANCGIVTIEREGKAVYFRDDGSFRFNGEWQPGNRIIAWMPFPEPPKEENEDE